MFICNMFVWNFNNLWWKNKLVSIWRLNCFYSKFLWKVGGGQRKYSAASNCFLWTVLLGSANVFNKTWYVKGKLCTSKNGSWISWKKVTFFPFLWGSREVIPTKRATLIVHQIRWQLNRLRDDYNCWKSRFWHYFKIMVTL